jgi:hypothetical protein
MSRKASCFLTLITLIFLAPLPAIAAQADPAQLRAGVMVNLSIAPATNDGCTLSDTQRAIEVDESSSSPYVFVRSTQNVDMYIRFGEKVTIEDGRIIADYSSTSPTGIENIALPEERKGTYFVAIVNCSQSVAEYSFGYWSFFDAAMGVAVHGCKLIRNPAGGYSLKISGVGFRKEDVVVWVGNSVPKKFRTKNLDRSGFTYTTIIAKGKVCRQLPAIISVANRTDPLSGNGVCLEVCPNQ